MFDFSKIIQDLMAKAALALGVAIGTTGYVTDAQKTAIVGGLIAAAGAVWNAITNWRTRKDVAIVAVANDEKKTTADVATAVADAGKVLRPVGTTPAKKNFSSR